MMAGALLFVISDSLLAINKFYQPFEWQVCLLCSRMAWLNFSYNRRYSI